MWSGWQDAPGCLCTFHLSLSIKSTEMKIVFLTEVFRVKFCGLFFSVCESKVVFMETYLERCERREKKGEICYSRKNLEFSRIESK